MTIRNTIILFIITCFIACNSEQQKQIEPKTTTSEIEKNSTLLVNPKVALEDTLSDTSFVSLNKYAEGFAYDMRYATSNNFLNKKVYDCAECLIRKQVADALLKANKILKTKGLRIKFYDCYRPLYIQKMMWEVYPNANYVANPKYGSIHNRGGAVDLTLVTDELTELDMGTKFDHFGIEAHHSYNQLDAKVLENRKLLRKTMETIGFSALESEWWHYNFITKKPFPIANYKAECD